MKILLLNQSFVSPDEPGHTRHFEMGQYLKQRGHELIIVASDANYQTGQRIVAHRGLSVEQNIDGVRVIRSYIYPALNRAYFWHIISFFSFMFSSVWTSLQVKEADIIMGTTPPIFQAVSAWFVAFVRRKPFLLEVRDLWPEFGIGMGALKNPVLIFLARWLEHFLYARATHILVNSPAYVDYLRGKGVPENKITFIPYGTDVDMFTPDVDGSQVREKFKLQDKFVVLYAGGIGQAKDIDTVLRAASRLVNDQKIRFILFGDGRERARLQAEAVQKNLTNVIFAGICPKKEMPGVIAASDVCLAILQDIPMFRTTYPNKVFDYMAAGRATVLVIDGVIRKIIEESNGGVFVQPGNDEMLAKTILEMSTDSARVKKMGISAREYLVKNLDRHDKLAETLILFQSLTS